ncbi:unnamed protein product [Cuscuta europaea]|uniref:BZIP domain-containing protein n=1 Tax=Cuscuta europaea TaxID=41803 RepID=A0A9P0Z3E6_CUSEU|nr:unnamed protein product [Cuscuta europaea]
MRPPVQSNRMASSFSSSSSSSSYPFSPHSFTTMEQVWEDINLSSLHNHLHSTSSSNRAVLGTTSAAAAGINFQDFLTQPAFSGKGRAPLPNAEASPPMLLDLNSIAVPDLHFMPPPPPPRMRSVDLEDLGCFSAGRGGDNNGRILKRSVDDSDQNSTDRRHKRMIKNRQSAARSRARKQAYTTQLEEEAHNLVEENNKLKLQLQQLCASEAPTLKKSSLHRTSSAPF